MIIYDEDGQFNDDYMAFMDEEIMPQLRELFEKMKAYLDANGATGLDYQLMNHYFIDSLKMSADIAFVEYIEKRDLGEAFNP